MSILVIVFTAPLAAMDVRRRTSPLLPASHSIHSALPSERPVVSLELRENAPRWLKIWHGVYLGGHRAYFGFLVPLARWVVIPNCVLALTRMATRPDVPDVDGPMFGKPIARQFLTGIFMVGPALCLAGTTLGLASSRLFAPRSFALQHNGRKLSSVILSKSLEVPLEYLKFWERYAAAMLGLAGTMIAFTLLQQGFNKMMNGRKAVSDDALTVITLVSLSALAIIILAVQLHAPFYAREENL